MHALDVVGDPVRRRIVEVLADGELTSGAVTVVVQEEFQISQPAVSQHLRVLREAGFVTVTPQGARRLYSLAPAPLQEIATWVARFRRFWGPAPGRPRDRSGPWPSPTPRTSKEHRRDMTDIVNRINAVHRAVREQRIPAGDGTSTLLRRRFDTPVEDLWEACTTPERVARWLAPVAGDLREGGMYQLEGNARGDILRCEPPRLLKVNWVYGENVTEADISEVELRLTPDGADATLLELEHTAVADPEMWAQYGPGATGVGWDLGLLGLTLHLEGEPAPDDETFHSTPDGREFISRSSNAWAAANVAAGASPEEAERKAANTTAFFAPES